MYVWVRQSDLRLCADILSRLYICIHMCVYVCEPILRQTSRTAFMCPYIFVHAHMHTRLHAHMYTGSNTRIHAHMCTGAHRRIHTHQVSGWFSNRVCCCNHCSCCCTLCNVCTRRARRNRVVEHSHVSGIVYVYMHVCMHLCKRDIHTYIYACSQDAYIPRKTESRCGSTVLTTCIYVCMYVCMYVFTLRDWPRSRKTHVCIRMHACMKIYAYVYMYMCKDLMIEYGHASGNTMHTHIPSIIYRCMPIPWIEFLYAYMYTHQHPHIRIHVQTHTCIP